MLKFEKSKLNAIIDGLDEDIVSLVERNQSLGRGYHEMCLKFHAELEAEKKKVRTLGNTCRLFNATVFRLRRELDERESVTAMESETDSE